MPAETDATAALDLIERDGFRTGSGWAKAHVITQAHEGTPLFDAIHAFLHRIEGDVPNAAYWVSAGGHGFRSQRARIRTNRPARLHEGRRKVTHLSWRLSIRESWPAKMRHFRLRSLRQTSLTPSAS